MPVEFPSNPENGQFLAATNGQLYCWSAPLNAWLPAGGQAFSPPGADPGNKTIFLPWNVSLATAAPLTNLLNTGNIGDAGQQWKISAMAYGYVNPGAAWIWFNLTDGADILAQADFVVENSSWTTPCLLEAIVTLQRPTSFTLQGLGYPGTGGFALGSGRSWTVDGLFTSLTSQRLT